MEVEKIEFIKEIDSDNYVEGFDLKYQDLSLRLYDDERSEEVLADIDFRNGKLTGIKPLKK
ncbi:hypothetical protein G3O08_04830 [Cryomorpha ignava]|uniref:DUF2283 domain-containing protein n=1 Tax=Cryomorpha ignava TaxID=101383 RepID=A0A7K3WMW0_9FLAO|nr:hypothetical protein [Cryomorpha ignava]NEN22824.1 hypothetical protein [Cryomorpha ignava]